MARTVGARSAPLEMKAQTLPHLLQERAEQLGAQSAFIFLPRGEGEEQKLGYADLHAWSYAIAARLQEQIVPGQRVLLVLPPTLTYVAAFFACLQIGAVAVPVYPPRLNRSLDRLEKIIESAGIALALTDAVTAQRIAELDNLPPQVKSLRWLPVPETLSGSGGGAPRAVDIGPDTLAFLQYTSGSTGDPKGVMLTHRNLLSNERMIFESFQEGQDCVVVGWLPFYHDMGLIGNIIHPIYLGASCVLMPPTAFLQQPVRWLKAITRYRATTSGGPNFAYDLCVSRISDQHKTQLDLSSWRVAFNGAERVRPQTLHNFAAAFQCAGFSPNSFLPCYGMAEASLFLTGVAKGSIAACAEQAEVQLSKLPSPSGRRWPEHGFVSCGVASPGLDVAVVDPVTLAEVTSGIEGEVWVAGENIAQGYWNRPEETAASFGWQLSGRPGQWFRTGDLGCLIEGELFITGRSKDLIIVNGRNHHPQDLEYTVERVDSAIAANGVAAFAMIDAATSVEALALVAEIDRDAWRRVDGQSLIAKIITALVAQHELSPAQVVLIRPGQLPKTSSGKIQRRRTREALQQGEFDVLHAYAANTQPRAAALQATATALDADSMLTRSA